MKSILYFGGNDIMGKYFLDMISLKGYLPIVCWDEPEIFYQLAFDRVLRKARDPNIEHFVTEFKEIMDKAGFIKSGFENDSHLKKVIKNQIKTNGASIIDAFILDTRANSYINNVMGFCGDIHNKFIPLDNLEKRMENITRKQIKGLSEDVGLVNIIRKIGYDEPIIICGGFNKIGMYNVDGSFLDVGADIVLRVEDFASNFNRYLNEVELKRQS